MDAHAPTCSNCNYSRAGLADSALCPECGRAFVPATGLAAQPRRVRWCWLIGGVILAAWPLLHWALRQHNEYFYASGQTFNTITGLAQASISYYVATFGFSILFMLLCASLAMLCVPMRHHGPRLRVVNFGALALTLLTLVVSAVSFITYLVLENANPMSWDASRSWRQLLRIWHDAQIQNFSWTCASVWFYLASRHVRSRVMRWTASVLLAGMLVCFALNLAVILTGDQELLRWGQWRDAAQISSWVVLFAFPATGLTCAWLAWRALGRREPFGVIWAFLKRNLS